jgi:O-antigen/teichoic acid export membrane protein
MMASVLVLGISTSVSMSLFGADLLTPFLPANIIEASSRLLLIVPFAFTAEVLNTYVLLLPFELTKKRWLNTQVAIFKFAVFLPIFMVLINSYGVWGAAVAQCITLSLTMLFTLYMSQKHTPIRQSLLLPILSFTWSIVFVLIIKSTLDIWDDWSLNLLFATACTAGIFAVMIQTLLAFVLAKKAPEIKLNGETN